MQLNVTFFYPNSVTIQEREISVLRHLLGECEISSFSYEGKQAILILPNTLALSHKDLETVAILTGSMVVVASIRNTSEDVYHAPGVSPTPDRSYYIDEQYAKVRGHKSITEYMRNGTTNFFMTSPTQDVVCMIVVNGAQMTLVYGSEPVSGPPTVYKVVTFPIGTFFTELQRETSRSKKQFVSRIPGIIERMEEEDPNQVITCAWQEAVRLAGWDGKEPE